MKNRINNILVGILWLLAVTLGANFWFNTKYGFNLFSFQHWQYLAYMQASNQPVKNSFYLSILLCVILMVFGLYVLMQPRRHKIVLPIFDRSSQHEPTQQPQNAVAPKPEKTVEEQKPVPQTKTYAGPVLTRPPRLNTPIVSHAPMPNVPMSSLTPTNKQQNDQNYAEIQDIFTSAGFLVKGAPKIKNVQTSVIAIGPDEILWIGATGVSIQDMKKAVDTLNGVFLDTLEDIEININAFVIGATGTSDDEDDSKIMRFDTVNDLRNYINEHPNPQMDESDTENFDAYSAYIGTVIDYIRKI